MFPCFVLSVESSWERCGFQGSSTLISLRDEVECSTVYECGHLAMTYTGLASLVILGDDLSRVNRPAIIEGVKALQQEDGRLVMMCKMYLRYLYLQNFIG
jgi:geranylgeranyl transferase type-1 subunit beta